MSSPRFSPGFPRHPPDFFPKFCYMALRFYGKNRMKVARALLKSTAVAILTLNIFAADFLFAQQFETVFEDSTYQLTGVAVSKSGRLFTNYPHWDGPYLDALVEIRDGKKVPYPDSTWSRHKFTSVQAVVIDEKDRMWVVEPRAKRIVRINISTDKVESIWALDSVVPGRGYLNDIRIDSKNEFAYITNSGEGGGLVVLDLKKSRARQVLRDRDCVLADSSYVFKSGLKPLINRGKPYRANSDGIALSKDLKFIYFKALTDDRLFRIPTSALKNFFLSDDALEKLVEFLGRFTTSDGIEFDDAGNLYLGDLENRRIVKITPQLQMIEIKASRELFPWPDSYAFRNGYLYISCSRIDDEPKYHDGAPVPGPYKIMRFKPGE